MTEPMGTDVTRVELYVRGATAVDLTIAAIVDSLRGLRDAGSLDSVEVVTWPGRVNLRRVGDEDSVVGTFKRFRSWAREHGDSIEPPFRVAEQRSAYTGDRDEVLHTPLLFCAAYAGETLREVVPRTRGGETITVERFIAALQTEAAETFDTRPSSDLAVNGSV